MPSVQVPVLSKDELLTALKSAARLHGMHCRPVDHEGLRADLETTSARWLFGGRKVTYHFGCRLDESKRTMRFREAVTEETWGIPAPFFWAEKSVAKPRDQRTAPEAHGPEIAGPIEYHRIRHEIEQLAKESGWAFTFERGQRP